MESIFYSLIENAVIVASFRHFPLYLQISSFPLCHPPLLAVDFLGEATYMPLDSMAITVMQLHRSKRLFPSESSARVGDAPPNPRSARVE
jgi:hypothetical protein